MGIAITDDHRELAEVARGFLTSQKARWAARSLLDASDEPRPGFWQNLAELGWLGLHVDSWSINLDEAPSGREALWTLLAAAAALACASAWWFGRREIRVKTPEEG